MNGDVPKFSLIKFKTVIRDARGPSEPGAEVLDTQEELDAYLESCQDKPKPKHKVAFPDERAIAIAMGERRTGGYSVEVIAVVQETGGFVGVQHHVLYAEHIPQGPSTDNLTYPHHVIRVRGLSGIVSFRQVPDTIGHSLRALTGATAVPGGTGDAALFTTLAVGEETPPPTTLAVGEETSTPTTLAVGEETPPPTTLAVGEEAQAAITTLAVGEETPRPTTLATGEETPPPPTTLATGEETPPPTTLAAGEETSQVEVRPTTLAFPGEEHTTAHVGEHPTTLMYGEEHPTAHFAEHPTTLAYPGEEHPTAHVGEHPTTLAYPHEEHPTAHVGEHPTTLAYPHEEHATHHVGEHPTTLAYPHEEHTTHHVGEHPTTLVFPGEEHLTTLITGEESHGHGGGGPFG